MVAQIDEKHPAMIPFAVHPAGKADGGSDILPTEFGAFMAAIDVHDQFVSKVFDRKM
jgi:hypothetical protein